MSNKSLVKIHQEAKIRKFLREFMTVGGVGGGYQLPLGMDPATVNIEKSNNEFDSFSEEDKEKMEDLTGFSLEKFLSDLKSKVVSSSFSKDALKQTGVKTKRHLKGGAYVIKPETRQLEEAFKDEADIYRYGRQHVGKTPLEDETSEELQAVSSGQQQEPIEIPKNVKRIPNIVMKKIQNKIINYFDRRKEEAPEAYAQVMLVLSSAEEGGLDPKDIIKKLNLTDKNLTKSLQEITQWHENYTHNLNIKLLPLAKAYIETYVSYIKENNLLEDYLILYGTSKRSFLKLLDHDEILVDPWNLSLHLKRFEQRLNDEIKQRNISSRFGGAKTIKNIFENIGSLLVTPNAKMSIPSIVESWSESSEEGEQAPSAMNVSNIIKRALGKLYFHNFLENIIHEQGTLNSYISKEYSDLLKSEVTPNKKKEQRAKLRSHISNFIQEQNHAFDLKENPDRAKQIVRKLKNKNLNPIDVDDINSVYNFAKQNVELWLNELYTKFREDLSELEEDFDETSDDMYKQEKGSIKRQFTSIKTELLKQVSIEKEYIHRMPYDFLLTEITRLKDYINESLHSFERMKGNKKHIKYTLLNNEAEPFIDDTEFVSWKTGVSSNSIVPHILDKITKGGKVNLDSIDENQLDEELENNPEIKEKFENLSKKLEVYDDIFASIKKAVLPLLSISKQPNEIKDALNSAISDSLESILEILKSKLEDVNTLNNPKKPRQYKLDLDITERAFVLKLEEIEKTLQGLQEKNLEFDNFYSKFLPKKEKELSEQTRLIEERLNFSDEASARPYMPSELKNELKYLQEVEPITVQVEGGEKTVNFVDINLLGDSKRIVESYFDIIKYDNKSEILEEIQKYIKNSVLKTFIDSLPSDESKKTRPIFNARDLFEKLTSNALYGNITALEEELEEEYETFDENLQNSFVKIFKHFDSILKKTDEIAGETEIKETLTEVLSILSEGLDDDIEVEDRYSQKEYSTFIATLENLRLLINEIELARARGLVSKILKMCEETPSDPNVPNFRYALDDVIAIKEILDNLDKLVRNNEKKENAINQLLFVAISNNEDQNQALKKLNEKLISIRDLLEINNRQDLLGEVLGLDRLIQFFINKKQQDLRNIHKKVFYSSFLLNFGQKGFLENIPDENGEIKSLISDRKQEVEKFILKVFNFGNLHEIKLFSPEYRKLIEVVENFKLSPYQITGGQKIQFSKSEENVFDEIYSIITNNVLYPRFKKEFEKTFKIQKEESKSDESEEKIREFLINIEKIKAKYSEYFRRIDLIKDAFEKAPIVMVKPKTMFYKPKLDPATKSPIKNTETIKIIIPPKAGKPRRVETQTIHNVYEISSVYAEDDDVFYEFVYYDKTRDGENKQQREYEDSDFTRQYDPNGYIVAFRKTKEFIYTPEQKENRKKIKESSSEKARQIISGIENLKENMKFLFDTELFETKISLNQLEEIQEIIFRKNDIVKNMIQKYDIQGYRNEIKIPEINKAIQWAAEIVLAPPVSKQAFFENIDWDKLYVYADPAFNSAIIAPLEGIFSGITEFFQKSSSSLPKTSIIQGQKILDHILAELAINHNVISNKIDRKALEDAYSERFGEDSGKKILYHRLTEDIINNDGNSLLRRFKSPTIIKYSLLSTNKIIDLKEKGYKSYISEVLSQDALKNPVLFYKFFQDSNFVLNFIDTLHDLDEKEQRKISDQFLRLFTNVLESDFFYRKVNPLQSLRKKVRDDSREQSINFILLCISVLVNIDKNDVRNVLENDVFHSLQITPEELIEQIQKMKNVSESLMYNLVSTLNTEDFFNYFGIAQVGSESLKTQLKKYKSYEEGEEELSDEEYLNYANLMQKNSMSDFAFRLKRLLDQPTDDLKNSLSHPLEVDFDEIYVLDPGENPLSAQENSPLEGLRQILYSNFPSSIRNTLRLGSEIDLEKSLKNLRSSNRETTRRQKLQNELDDLIVQLSNAKENDDKVLVAQLEDEISIIEKQMPELIEDDLKNKKDELEELKAARGDKEEIKILEKEIKELQQKLKSLDSGKEEKTKISKDTRILLKMHNLSKKHVRFRKAKSSDMIEVSDLAEINETLDTYLDKIQNIISDLTISLNIINASSKKEINIFDGLSRNIASAIEFFKIVHSLTNVNDILPSFETIERYLFNTFNLSYADQDTIVKRRNLITKLLNQIQSTGIVYKILIKEKANLLELQKESIERKSKSKKLKLDSIITSAEAHSKRKFSGQLLLSILYMMLEDQVETFTQKDYSYYFLELYKNNILKQEEVIEKEVDSNNVTFKISKIRIKSPFFMFKLYQNNKVTSLESFATHSNLDKADLVEIDCNKIHQNLVRFYTGIDKVVRDFVNSLFFDFDTKQIKQLSQKHVFRLTANKEIEIEPYFFSYFRGKVFDKIFQYLELSDEKLIEGLSTQLQNMLPEYFMNMEIQEKKSEALQDVGYSRATKKFLPVEDKTKAAEAAKILQKKFSEDFNNLKETVGNLYGQGIGLSLEAEILEKAIENETDEAKKLELQEKLEKILQKLSEQEQNQKEELFIQNYQKRMTQLDKEIQELNRAISQAYGSSAITSDTLQGKKKGEKKDVRLSEEQVFEIETQIKNLQNKKDRYQQTYKDIISKREKMKEAAQSVTSSFSQNPFQKKELPKELQVKRSETSSKQSKEKERLTGIEQPQQQSQNPIQEESKPTQMVYFDSWIQNLSEDDKNKIDTIINFKTKYSDVFEGVKQSESQVKIQTIKNVLNKKLKSADERVKNVIGGILEFIKSSEKEIVEGLEKDLKELLPEDDVAQKNNLEEYLLNLQEDFNSIYNNKKIEKISSLIDKG